VTKKKLNRLFKTNYRPVAKSTSTISIILKESLKEIDKLVRGRPEGGRFEI